MQLASLTIGLHSGQFQACRCLSEVTRTSEKLATRRGAIARLHAQQPAQGGIWHELRGKVNQQSVLGAYVQLEHEYKQHALHNRSYSARGHCIVLSKVVVLNPIAS
jgi:hypothetical protein